MDAAQFLSPKGFPPSLWGPGLWLFMTLVAANYPLNPTKRDAMRYFTFFYNLQYILPCKTCRQEYSKMLTTSNDRITLEMFSRQRHDLPGDARRRVFQWVVDIHDRVNTRLGKTSVAKVSADAWATYYAAMRSMTPRQIARGMATPLQHIHPTLKKKKKKN